MANKWAILSTPVSYDVLHVEPGDGRLLGRSRAIQTPFDLLPLSYVPPSGYPRGDRSLKFLTRSPETTRAIPSKTTDSSTTIRPTPWPPRWLPSCQRRADELFFADLAESTNWERPVSRRDVYEPWTTLCSSLRVRSRAVLQLGIMIFKNSLQRIKQQGEREREREEREATGKFFKRRKSYRIDWKTKKSKDGRWPSG